MRIAMALMAVLALAIPGSVQADEGDGQLIRFKAGEISFTLLQSDGVMPMSAAELKLLSPENGSVQAEAVSDHLGRAAVALSEGRYLLNVSGQNLSVLDVAGDATLTSCRVVVPDAALLVAGQEEEEEEDDDDNIGAILVPVLIGGAVVFVAAGAYAVYDHNKDDDDKDGDDGNPPPPPPANPKDKDDDDDDDGPSLL